MIVLKHLCIVEIRHFESRSVIFQSPAYIARSDDLNHARFIDSTCQASCMCFGLGEKSANGLCRLSDVLRFKLPSSREREEPSGEAPIL